MRAYFHISSFGNLVFQEKTKDLDSIPNSLDDLKFVLRTITSIKEMSLDVETQVRDLQERYRILDMYNLLVGDGQLSHAPI